MPIAGEAVAKELSLVCEPRDRCTNLNNWLNRLYIFKAKYQVYQENLK